MVRVRAYPRLHVGLIDLGHVTHRDHGGAGFTVEGPSIEVIATASNSLQYDGFDNLDPKAKDDLVGAVSRLQSAAGKPLGVRLALGTLPAQHVGLGTKTALLLATLAAINHELELAQSATSLQYLSGRGGTSGIGIHSFFAGGFIVDGGHSAMPGAGEYVPSSAHRPIEIPPVVSRVPIPESWTFHLVLPSGRSCAGRQEVEFFRKNTPIPRDEVLHTLALVYHGLIPAVLRRDLRLLRDVLQAVHRTGFKSREVAWQSPEVFAALCEFQLLWPAGMSSLGPMLYVITEDPVEASEVREACTRLGLQYVGAFNGRNSGYEILREGAK